MSTCIRWRRVGVDGEQMLLPRWQNSGLRAAVPDQLLHQLSITSTLVTCSVCHLLKDETLEVLLDYVKESEAGVPCWEHSAARNALRVGYLSAA